MSIAQYLPSPDWREYIAAYWVRETEPDLGISERRVYADGCADLICNAGQNMVYYYPLAGRKHAIPLYPGHVYLGGTMTAYGVVRSDAKCLLTGIRFWPGGFYALFEQSMQTAVNSLLPYPDKELCSLMRVAEDLDTRLDKWLGDWSASGRSPGSGSHEFVMLRKRMYESGGQVSVEALARQMNVSSRTLERIFKRNVGIPPKEFLRIVRFQEVLRRLRTAGDNHGSTEAGQESLLHIAYEMGYFDHAHLTHEFKHYAGILPSELSHFYKAGLSSGPYF